MRNQSLTCLALAFWRKLLNGLNRKRLCPRWLATAIHLQKRLGMQMIRVTFAVFYPRAHLLRTAAGSNSAASRTQPIISGAHATSRVQDLQGIPLLKRNQKVPNSNSSSFSPFHHNVWNHSLSYLLTHAPSLGSIAPLPKELGKAHKRLMDSPSGQGMATGIKEYSNSSSGANTLSCSKSARSSNDKGRSEQTTRETGYSGGAACEGSIPESTIHSTETRWISSTGNKSEALEPPYPETTLQDGRDHISKELAQTGRLDGLYRSQRCVPLRIHGCAHRRYLRFQ